MKKDLNSRFASTRPIQKNLKVISFEPILESFNQIKKSKEANNLNKMEIFQFALSNENAEKNFWVTDLKKKSGFALLDDKDLKQINKLIRDVVGDILRDIWLKRNAWK